MDNLNEEFKQGLALTSSVATTTSGEPIYSEQKLQIKSSQADIEEELAKLQSALVAVTQQKITEDVMQASAISAQQINAQQINEHENVTLLMTSQIILERRLLKAFLHKIEESYKSQNFPIYVEGKTVDNPSPALADGGTAYETILTIQNLSDEDKG